MPKSVIRTSPWSSISTLAGLRSRCSTPCACAAARPAHSCRPMSTTFSEGSRPTRRSSAARSSPSHQLHRVEDAAVGLADVEHAAHRRMRDLPREPDFVEDALAAFRGRRVNQLQRDRRSAGRGRRRARRRPCRRGRCARSSDSGRRTPRLARTRRPRAPAPLRRSRRLRETPAATRPPARRAASSPHASARTAARSGAACSSAARNTSFARWCSDDMAISRARQVYYRTSAYSARAASKRLERRIGAAPRATKKRSYACRAAVGVRPASAAARASPRCASGYSGEVGASPRWSRMLWNCARRRLRRPSAEDTPDLADRPARTPPPARDRTA